MRKKFNTAAEELVSLEIRKYYYSYLRHKAATYILDDTVVLVLSEVSKLNELESR